MRFVPVTTVEQQDLQMLHRIRSRLIGSRTQLGNQVRGLLAEYGIVMAVHLSTVRQTLPALVESHEQRLTEFAKRRLRGMHEELRALDERLLAVDALLARVHQTNPLCQRIAAVEGIGPVIATAVVAAVADGRTFSNGRQFSAWIGLVPRQHSSGDKQRLFGITKRGDPYLRTLLVHGARSVVYRAGSKRDTRSQWIAAKQRQLGTAKTCVAVANKNARIIWALLARNVPYRRPAQTVSVGLQE
jgi:transposase